MKKSVVVENSSISTLVASSLREMITNKSLALTTLFTILHCAVHTEP